MTLCFWEGALGHVEGARGYFVKVLAFSVGTDLHEAGLGGLDGPLSVDVSQIELRDVLSVGHEVVKGLCLDTT